MDEVRASAIRNVSKAHARSEAPDAIRVGPKEST